MIFLSIFFRLKLMISTSATRDTIKIMIRNPNIFLKKILILFLKNIKFLGVTQPLLWVTPTLPLEMAEPLSGQMGVACQAKWGWFRPPPKLALRVAYLDQNGSDR
jgi:hypothetical protein